METLEIKREAALTAYGNAKNSGKKMLEDLFGKKTFQKDIMERIKTFDDVLEDQGRTREDFDNSCKGLSSDEIGYRKCKLIVKCLNEGWRPDFTDSSQPKYFPWFKLGSSSGAGFSYDDCDHWHSFSHCGSRLCFKTSELAKYAGRQFLNEWKQYSLI